MKLPSLAPSSHPLSTAQNHGHLESTLTQEREEQQRYWKEDRIDISASYKVDYTPSINILNDIQTMHFTMFLNQIFIDPCNKMILEGALDNLIK